MGLIIGAVVQPSAIDALTHGSSILTVARQRKHDIPARTMAAGNPRFTATCWYLQAFLYVSRPFAACPKTEQAAAPGPPAPPPAPPPGPPPFPPPAPPPHC